MSNQKYIIVKTYNFKLIWSKEFKNIIKKVKILNKKSIFLTGIPQYLNIEQWKKYKYLGQYGEILKILKSKDKNNNKKTFSVYVTYRNKFQSSMAIKCLNKFKFDKKIMSCSYASKKVCFDYLFEKECKTQNCTFYHGKINKNNSILKILKFTNYDIINHFTIINDTFIYENIIYLKKLYDSNNYKKTIFPNIKCKINTLLDNQ